MIIGVLRKLVLARCVQRVVVQSDIQHVVVLCVFRSGVNLSLSRCLLRRPRSRLHGRDTLGHDVQGGCRVLVASWDLFLDLWTGRRLASEVGHLPNKAQL
jgi:hypothetical protein